MDRRLVVLKMRDPRQKHWHIGLDELINIFRRSLVTLIPVFDEAKIAWWGQSTYDDYDRIAEALYDSIVHDSLTNARSLEAALPLARYGVRQPGREFSHILVNDPSDRLAFHEFDSETEPFDTIVCLRVGVDGREATTDISTMPFGGQHFTYEATYGPSRAPSYHRSVEVIL
jgi:hypothetical protein